MYDPTTDDGKPDISTDSLSAVPLFPLPNVVLLPSAILPLHTFEERYKAMTADVLVGDPALSRRSQLAMSLLKPGWERQYYSQPSIDPVVCVGTILNHERLPDGRYNFLLRGVTRARVVRELSPRDTGKPYRIARLEPLFETDVCEIDLSGQRECLLELFGSSVLGETPFGAQMRKLLCGPMRTSQIVDLLSFSLFEDPLFKQSLLSETDVCKRVNKAIAAVQRLAPLLVPKSPGVQRVSAN